MSRIERLTEDQIARLPEFVDQWTKIGLCTDPADRPRAETAICEMYRQGGLEPPGAIVWCGSPAALGLTRAILDKKLINEIGDSVWARVADSVWAGVANSVRDSVLANVDDSMGDSVLESVWDSVWASVRTNVEASVGGSVEASVRIGVLDSVQVSVSDNVWHSVWDSVVGSVWDHVSGSHDAAWLCIYRYFRDVAGLAAQTSKLSGLWELAQSAGWALPLRNICWVSERHNVLKRDDRGRLHSLKGPACAYPDGWTIYAVHGVRVPRYVIERPAEISVEKIDTETDAEVRRVMIERYRHGEEVSGSAAYIRDAGGERPDHEGH
jgi:hypothetical protein